MTNPGPLTERQREVYRVILAHYQQWGLPPTIREMCAAANMASTSTAYYFVRKLAGLGLVKIVNSHPVPLAILKHLESFDFQGESTYGKR
jgi:repressor LexA